MAKPFPQETAEKQEVEETREGQRSVQVPRGQRQHSQAGNLSVAIVGAGISGLVAGHTLRNQGIAVKVFDKARGPGGRTSTRRHHEYRFDHGAQYFTARDPRFRRHVNAWVETGIVEEWAGRIAVVGGGAVVVKESDIERFVGVPGMNAVARHLAADLNVVFGNRVEKIERVDGRWLLITDKGIELGTFDAVLVTAPPAQSAPLLAPAPELASQIEAVAMRPCWALMTIFDERLELPFDGAFVEASPLSWIARNNSKPGRPGDECWVLHGSPEWSARHLEDGAEDIEDALLTAFFQAVGHDSRTPTFARAHRWRYSIAANPLQVGCLWNADLRLGSCGDWCSGSRIEGAFLSGMAAADRILGLTERSGTV